MASGYRKALSDNAPYAVLVLCLWAIFQLNVGGIAPRPFFESFQLNGQARVLGGIVAEDRGLDKRGANMGKVYAGPGFDEEGSVGETYRAFSGDSPANLTFEPYPTQYGFQEVFYGLVARHTPLNTLGELQAIPSLLTALVLVVLFRRYLSIFGAGFSWLILLGMAASPWFIAFARNLYWNPFLLLLPAVFAAFLYSEKTPWRRGLLLGGVTAAMFVKCLTNYEYITSASVLAAAVFIVGPYFSRNSDKPRPDFAMAAAVMLACVIGFALAFLIHANARGDTLLEGFQSIYEQDIARRTYGDAAKYSGEAGDSLRASPLDVMRIYLFEWPERRRMILPGKLFLVLLGASLAGIGWMFAEKHPHRFRNFWMLSTYAFVPFSWYIFAKGHAYTQTHINFVLLYIGFIPALLFVSFDVFVMVARKLYALAPKGRPTPLN